MLLLCTLLVPPAFGAETTDSVNSSADFAMQWKKSLPVDERDSSIGIIGGTEARSLVGMDGRLYAGIGYWSDSQENNPRLPGGQVLVLDSPKGNWKVDLNLDQRITTGAAAGKRRYFAIAMLYGATFKSDFKGRALAQPIHMLLAGAWDRAGQLQVFSKLGTSGAWTTTDLSPANESHHAEIRSFFVYRDKVTNIEHVFAGTRVNNVPDSTRIYSGTFDSSDEKIHWDKTQEAWGKNTPDLSRTTRASGRITGFAECNGKLYASVYNMIFERQDGPHPIWNLVYSHVPQKPFEEGSSGFRGLSAVNIPGQKYQQLLVTLEHNPCIIFRINPSTFKSVAEINVSAKLREQWNTKVGYIIAGYNDMLACDDPLALQPLTLIGMETATPMLEGRFHSFNADAHYLVRRGDGQYSVQPIADHTLDYRPNMVSVRTMVRSPFADDPAGTIYAGGFDANSVPVHNTAWIYRGVRQSPPQSSQR